MSSAIETAPATHSARTGTPATPTAHDQTRSHFRGGRGGSRGGSSSEQRGARRGGMADRGNRTIGNNNQRGRHVSGPENRPAPSLPPPPGLSGGGSFGDRLTEDAETKEGEGLLQQQDQNEAEICFICASPVVHNSVAPCNHRTCHICALRLRALYKTRACAHCRVCNSVPGCMPPLLIPSRQSLNS